MIPKWIRKWPKHQWAKQDSGNPKQDSGNPKQDFRNPKPDFSKIILRFPKPTLGFPKSRCGFPNGAREASPPGERHCSKPKGGDPRGAGGVGSPGTITAKTIISAGLGKNWLHALFGRPCSR